MKTSIEAFINKENIRNFRKRLGAPVNDAQRETLLGAVGRRKNQSGAASQKRNGETTLTRTAEFHALTAP